MAVIFNKFLNTLFDDQNSISKEILLRNKSSIHLWKIMLRFDNESN